MVNTSCHAAEGERKISFANYFNEVPNVSIMRLLREKSNGSLAEACLSERQVINGLEGRRLEKKQLKQKEVNTKSASGIKTKYLQKTKGLGNSLWLEIFNGCFDEMLGISCKPKKKKTAKKEIGKRVVSPSRP